MAARKIRVFVSSTFRDMMAERDYLVKHIFPQLRKICERRGVAWSEVDLRWGIPDEDREEVLPLCLEEILRCRPFFIGLLGERYGYIPEAITPNLIERFPWISPRRGKSITELEMLLGCLAPDLPPQQAFFYFRDPAYLDRQPLGNNRSAFEDPPGPARDELARLKDEIREAARLGRCKLREPYRDVQELGVWVLADFSALIDQLYPAFTTPDPLDLERAEQQAFLGERAQVYIPRPEAFDRLDKHLNDTTPPLVVTGEPGIGKSALLANWYLNFTANEPGHFHLIHVIGSTSKSTNPTNILQRIMLEIKRYPACQGLTFGDVPKEASEVRKEFPSWIAKAVSAGRLLVMMDGIDHLHDETDLELGWLPETFPAACRLVLSIAPGRSLDVIRRRGWPEMEVQPLTEAERRQFIIDTLARYSRRLSQARLERISQAGQTANPLFLKSVLEELRQFGEHERLEERIEYYLGAPTLDLLFARILDRLESDYQEEEDLVDKSLSLIACSRYGLSEAELLELLGSSGQSLPHRKWTPFSLAVEPFLVNAGGRFDLGTPQFRRAVERRYLSTLEKELGTHRRLAAYFQALPLQAELLPDGGLDLKHSPAMDRVLDELPWQEARAGLWQSLASTLTLTQLFLAAYERDQGLEWLGYWQAIKRTEAEGRIRPVDIPGSYLREFHRLEGMEKLVLAGALGQFLKDAGYPDAADECFRAELEGYDAAVPLFLRAATLNDQAQLLASQGQNQKALSTYENAETILRAELQGEEAYRCLASILMNRANLMCEMGETQGVEERLQEALTLMKRTTGDDSAEVATVLQSLGNLAMAGGELPKAFSLHQQAYELRLKRLGPHHRDVGLSLFNLGVLLARQRKIFRAMECLERALGIFQETVGSEHEFTLLTRENLEQIRKLEN